MSSRKFVIVTFSLIVVSMATPSKASADWLLTPFIGVNWQGTANFTDLPNFDDEFEQGMNYGASLGVMGAGVFGWEIDFGFSPDFFKKDTGGFAEFDDSNVMTFMGNLILGIPIGGQSGLGFRPYAAAGVGLIKTNIEDPADFFDVSATDWGFNIGGGAFFFFGDNVGLRGDLRYFRALTDNEPDDEFDVAFGDFRFWRGTVGVTFRF
jgi:hypothetical protein